MYAFSWSENACVGGERAEGGAEKLVGHVLAQKGLRVGKVTKCAENRYREFLISGPKDSK